MLSDFCHYNRPTLKRSDIFSVSKWCRIRNVTIVQKILIGFVRSWMKRIVALFHCHNNAFVQSQIYINILPKNNATTMLPYRHVFSRLDLYCLIVDFYYDILNVLKYLSIDIHHISSTFRYYVFSMAYRELHSYVKTWHKKRESNHRSKMTLRPSLKDDPIKYRLTNRQFVVINVLNVHSSTGSATQTDASTY